MLAVICDWCAASVTCMECYVFYCIIFMVFGAMPEWQVSKVSITMYMLCKLQVLARCPTQHVVSRISTFRYTQCEVVARTHACLPRH
jgi:hypothetical protein